MSYHSRSLAIQGFQPSFGPTLAHRLISWVTRCASPSRSPAPADAPIPAEVLLERLLDRHPQARGVFLHLACVERCLRVQGIAALVDMPAGTLESAREELLSISCAAEVQPLLELFAAPLHPQAAPQRAAGCQASAGAVKAPSCIENLDVEEVDEEAYLTVLLEWEESGLLEAATQREARR